MHKPGIDKPIQKQVTVGYPDKEMTASKPQPIMMKKPEIEPNYQNEKQIAQTIPNIIQAFGNQREDLKKVILPTVPTKYREEFEKIEAARRNVHTVVENYFRQLSDSYMKLIYKTPSTELTSLINERIDRNLVDLEYYRNATEKGPLTKRDIDSFNEKDYHKQVTETSQQIANLQESSQREKINEGAYKDEAGKEFNFPKVVVDERILESVFRNLTDFISTTNVGNPPAGQSELSINVPDYFLNEERVLAVVNDHHKTISLFNLNAPRVVTLALKNQNEIPYSHSLIVTPDSCIIVTGGVFLSSGNITNACLNFNTSTVSLDDLEPMQVKRVGHTLVHAKKLGSETEGEIYAIGGKVDQTVRTKLCERYNINENKWEKIANLNQARSRAAVANFDNKFLYTFFGTDSFDNNVTTIERYSIELNHWELINAVNILPGLETTFGSACQINNNQILVFGGFSENEHCREMPTPNHRIATFNVLNDSFDVSTNIKLPLDFSISNSSSSMVIDGSVYSVGYFFESTSPELRRSLDCDYVLKINKNSAEMKSVMLSDRVYAKVDRSQRQPTSGNKEQEKN